MGIFEVGYILRMFRVGGYGLNITEPQVPISHVFPIFFVLGLIGRSLAIKCLKFNRQTLCLTDVTDVLGWGGQETGRGQGGCLRGVHLPFQ